MDWAAGKFVLEAAQLVLVVGAWIYAWRIKHDRALLGKIDEQAALISDHEIKLVTLSERMAAMPKHGDLEQIHDRISGVKDSVGDVRNDTAALVEAVGGLKRSFDILNSHHMSIKP